MTNENASKLAKIRWDNMTPEEMAAWKEKAKEYGSKGGWPKGKPRKQKEVLGNGK